MSPIRRKFALGMLVAVVAAIGAAPVYRAFRFAQMRRALSGLIREGGVVIHDHARLSVGPPARATARAELSVLSARVTADKVLQYAADVDAVEARRAAGVALYAQSRFGAAANELERAAMISGSAADWSDVAAATVSAALHEKAPQKLVAALVASNRAVASDSRSALAICNRAAVIEAMQLMASARAEWQRCLAAERDPLFRAQARARLATVTPDAESDAWRPLLQKLMDAAPSGRAPLVREAAERFRQHTRTQAESVLPVLWAEALLSGDARTAERHLSLARELAVEVRKITGDTFATDCLDVIDGTAGHPIRRAQLARAYVDYREGRILRGRNDSEGARVKLMGTSRQFASLSSPMGALSSSYAASALADQSQNAEAAKECEAVLREARVSSTHRGLVALLLWQVAHSRGVMGHWDVALAAAAESASLYDGLGEVENGGAMENMLAEIYDVLGQAERAWEHRRRAFHQLSVAGDSNRLQVALGGSSRILMRERNLPAALALLDLEAGVIPALSRADLLADVMARRASARAANGDVAGARNDIVRAREAAARIPDLKLRAKVDVDIDAAVGVAERTSHPGKSLDALTRAIAYAAANERAILLPELYLERGRIHLAAGSEDAAGRDFDAGIAGVAAQRRRMTDFALSGTVPNAAEALVREAVQLAVRRRDVVRAFQIAERAHGQALMDQLERRAGRVSAVRAPLPAGTVVVKYVVLPEQLVVFTLAHDLTMTVIPGDTRVLEARVSLWLSLIRDGAEIGDVRAAGADLHRILIGPIRHRLRRGSRIIFVPSKFLEGLPWGALYDGTSSRYLTEEVLIMTAPSAVFAMSTGRVSRRTAASKALIIGNPGSSSSYVDLPPLPAAAIESRRIAALHRPSLLITSDAATTRRFAQESLDATVIHFAGHAVSSERSEQQSFLVFSPDSLTGESGLLYSHDIARMSLDHTRLVVLAACGTLRGAAVHLDGVPSIARSFLAAGVPLVVGTLWDIEDTSSAILFQRIHRAMAQGTSVLAAVRDAQIDAIRSDDSVTSHPRTWAGVVLTGTLDH